MAKKIAILISGTGSIMQAILNHLISEAKLLQQQNFIVICNTDGTQGLEKAAKYGVKTITLLSKLKTRKEFEIQLLNILQQNEVDFIVLAGFMRILTQDFVAKYENKILNTHPSLLPSFKGAHAVKDALNYGVKITGTTVHFVNADLDGGKIIAQDHVIIDSTDTEETLHEKIKQKERILYPKVIANFVRGDNV